MNPIRFIKKCLTDPAAARKSLYLVCRSIYGSVYWTVHPTKPLVHRVNTSAELLLYPNHSFTQCFWPAIEAYEPDIQRLFTLCLKPGDVFVDCGANVGFFTVLAKSLIGVGGKVVAIEANPETKRLLDENLARNDIPPSVHAAITNTESAFIEFYSSEGAGDVYGSLVPNKILEGFELSVTKVPTIRLDDLIKEKALESVDLIKIDVEGLELEVLRSGKALIKQFRPLITCEFGKHTWGASGATPPELLELLSEVNYRPWLFDCEEDRFIPLPENVWDEEYVNLVLLPDESEHIEGPVSP